MSFCIFKFCHCPFVTRYIVFSILWKLKHMHYNCNYSNIIGVFSLKSFYAIKVYEVVKKSWNDWLLNTNVFKNTIHSITCISMHKALQGFLLCIWKHSPPPPTHTQDSFVSWSTILLITCRPSGIQIKKLSCLMLGKACSNGPLLIFEPTHWATALKAMN